MELRIYKLEGFKELESDADQLKEVYFIYGLCMSRLATIDSFFINFLNFNRYKFEGELVGKTYTKEQQEKFAAHYNDAATTKMIINDFRAKFDTTKFDDLFDELVKIRNLLAHKYMRFNWYQLPNRELREDIYDDLLYVFNFLNEFDEKMTYQEFYTRANSAYCMRWKGARKSE
jgi:uncharacterized protein with HEPN domain